MPEWLKTEHYPLVITFISSFLTFAGLFVTALFGYLASRRDKATANTITELRTIIERLGLDLEQAHKAHAEREAAEKCTDGKRKVAEERAAKLEVDLARYREVTVFGNWLVITHDPSPRSPICPNCYAKGRVLRMRQGTVDQNGVVSNWFYCPDRECRGKFHIARGEAEGLFQLLGGTGCYNGGPASSSKPRRIPPSNGIRLNL